ncbi:hypothetical protein HPB48_014900 [Haemaphysalis longicornis]|uniref:Uncharacterized protein n=1 Tax=Haemaphysalis longicornis TaxID=44386 RepID=A0A9J6GCK9_HAELO|nr:hypothetical protein HPB48_014900 [Haemaphysalis longicornis]
MEGNFKDQCTMPWWARPQVRRESDDPDQRRPRKVSENGEALATAETTGDTRSKDDTLSRKNQVAHSNIEGKKKDEQETQSQRAKTTDDKQAAGEDATGRQSEREKANIAIKMAAEKAGGTEKTAAMLATALNTARQAGKWRGATEN